MLNNSIASKYFNGNNPSYFEFVTCHCPTCQTETSQGHKEQSYRPKLDKVSYMADCFECGNTWVYRKIVNGVEIEVKP